jgi:hypothetical protein
MGRLESQVGDNRLNKTKPIFIRWFNSLRRYNFILPRCAVVDRLCGQVGDYSTIKQLEAHDGALGGRHEAGAKIRFD